jgi:hypothetical protein
MRGGRDLRNVARLACGLFVAAFLVGMSACQPALPLAVTGSGDTRVATPRVGSFSKVELDAPGSLIITQGAVDAVTIEAEDNLLPLLTATESGGRLVLAARPGAQLHPTRPIRYGVIMRTIDGINLTGSGDVDAVGINTDRLELLVNGTGQANIGGLAADVIDVHDSGSGLIRVGGNVPEQWITITGHGDYHGENLTSRAVHIAITGSGTCAVQAGDTLDVRVTGAGAVRYAGWPSVTEHVTGSATLDRQDGM